LMDYIGAIEENLGMVAEKNYLPIQPGDVPMTNADVNDLINDLGYKPNTSVKKGVKEFIKWYRKYFNI